VTAGGVLARTGRALGLTSEDLEPAEQALGRAHPLTCGLARQHRLAVQVLVATVPLVLGVTGVLFQREQATPVLGASSVVVLGLLAAFVMARHGVRDCVQTLIAEGTQGVFLQVVRRERRRLASPKVREHFARSLEQLLRDAQRWHSIAPHSRPLPGVEHLRHVPAEVRAVAAGLREDRPRVQGVAQTARLLFHGHSSPLYAGDTERLREDLRRIQYLLSSSSTRPVESNSDRLAA
jgi:hypothetical protein